MSLIHLLKVSAEITPGLTGVTVGVLEGSAQRGYEEHTHTQTRKLR